MDFVTDILPHLSGRCSERCYYLEKILQSFVKNLIYFLCKGNVSCWTIKLQQALKRCNTIYLNMSRIRHFYSNKQYFHPCNKVKASIFHRIAIFNFDRFVINLIFNFNINNMYLSGEIGTLNCDEVINLWSKTKRFYEYLQEDLYGIEKGIENENENKSLTSW